MALAKKIFLAKTDSDELFKSNWYKQHLFDNKVESLHLFNTKPNDVKTVAEITSTLSPDMLKELQSHR